jgi:hypothetical protein
MWNWIKEHKVLLLVFTGGTIALYFIYQWYISQQAANNNAYNASEYDNLLNALSSQPTALGSGGGGSSIPTSSTATTPLTTITIPSLADLQTLASPVATTTGSGLPSTSPSTSSSGVPDVPLVANDVGGFGTTGQVATTSQLQAAGVLSAETGPTGSCPGGLTAVQYGSAVQCVYVPPAGTALPAGCDSFSDLSNASCQPELHGSYELPGASPCAGVTGWQLQGSNWAWCGPGPQPSTPNPGVTQAATDALQTENATGISTDPEGFASQSTAAENVSNSLTYGAGFPGGTTTGVLPSTSSLPSGSISTAQNPAVGPAQFYTLGIPLVGNIKIPVTAGNGSLVQSILGKTTVTSS